MPRAIVCLPTYNERENLEPMVAALLERLGPDDRVLVIDDGSPDGTGEIADRLAGLEPRVSVLHRAAKKGLGPAYIAGFRRALDDGAELVLEMDCDFSHDPDDVPRLIEAADGADLVLGSRYVPGGRVEDWGALRRFVSRAGSLYAQVLLAVPRPRPDRGIQVLPARGARANRPGCRCRARLRVSDRDDLPRAARGLPGGRSADQVRRPACRDVEDEPGDRAEAIWRVPSLRALALLGRLR